MEQVPILQDLAVVMIVAGLVTLIFHRLKQPVVLGYILAGLIVGPYTPGIPLTIADKDSVESLAELGLVFLMFSLGLRFSLRKLARVGPTALLAGSLDIVVMIALGYWIGQAFGWSRLDSLFLGAIISISSTTIIIKALSDLGMTRQKFAQVIFGIQIIEDILAIAIITLLSAIATTGSLGVDQMAMTFARLCVFLITLLVLGLLIVPRVMDFVQRFNSPEMTLISVLGLCFGVSLLAVKLEFSVALGAFLIGAVMAETRQQPEIERLVGPLRDAFSAVFFVAVGMLINPAILAEYWLATAVITLAVILGKVASCSLGSFLAGNDPRTSMRVGMGVAQIGEFSFIIATLGMQLERTSEFLYPIAVGVSAATTLATPYLIRHSDAAVDVLNVVAPRPLTQSMKLYSVWLARRRRSRHSDQVRQLLRRWFIQIALNIALVTGVFAGAGFAFEHSASWRHHLAPWTGGPATVLFLAAMLVSLPMLVATFRKLRAAAMLIAEATVTRHVARAQTAVIRSVITNTILMAGSLALVIWLLTLSAAILPSGPTLVGLLTLLGIVTAVTWRWLIRVYAKAQIALRETLAQPPVAEAEPAGPPLPSVLQQAALETVTLPQDCPAAGKLIGDLAIRSTTGASILAIERGVESILNPGPEQRLQAGDRLLLLGSADQIRRARAALGLGDTPPGPGPARER